jgi:hypothetical protein
MSWTIMPLAASPSLETGPPSGRSSEPYLAHVTHEESFLIN